MSREAIEHMVFDDKNKGAILDMIERLLGQKDKYTVDVHNLKKMHEEALEKATKTYEDTRTEITKKFNITVNNLKTELKFLRESNANLQDKLYRVNKIIREEQP